MVRRKNKGQKNHTRIYIIEAAVVFALVIGLTVYAMIRSAGSVVNEKKAVEIGGETFSVADVNYFYYSFFDSYCEENEEYLPYMFDRSKSLKTQEYEEGRSWFSYFLDETVDSMANVMGAVKAAREDGFTLSEKGEANIRDYLDGIRSVAEKNGSDGDSYVADIYGADMSLERYRELMEYSWLAKEYSEHKEQSYTYSDEDIEKYYQEHSSHYIYADYERLYFKACDQDEEPTEEQKAGAEERARAALARIEKGETLKAVLEEYPDAVYYAAEDAYYSEGYSYGDWLFVEERNEGDSAVIDDGKGCYVMVFHSRSRREYATVNVRDILFAVDTSDLDTSAADYSTKRDQRYEESCKRAEEIFEEWTTGGATEELFASLADEYSSAAGREGGLCEKLVKDTLDSSVEQWCFDEARKPGDCEVVYGEDGFHLLYFVRADRPAWMQEVENDLRAEDMQSWSDGLAGTMNVKRYEKALDRAAGSLS
jgi:hypothetical protein